MATVRALPAVVILAFACHPIPLAQAGSVAERWCGKGVKGAHAGTLSVQQKAGFVLLKFDLAALPKGTKVHRARLYIRKSGDQPYDPILVYAAESVSAKAVKHSKRIRLEPPWYNRYDVTDTVRNWAANPKSNMGFAVKPFDGFKADRSVLQILYEGKPSNIPPQVTGLRAVHHHGQTFLVWTEHAAFHPKPEEILWVKKFTGFAKDELAKGPGEGAYGNPCHPAITLRTLRRLQGLELRDKATNNPSQGIRSLKRIRQVPAVAYRVYRHTKPITAGNVHEAEVLGDVAPLTGLDTEMYKIHYRGEYHGQREEPECRMQTLCVEDAKPLKIGETLYCHNIKKNGKAYYAVTCALAGTENVSVFGKENSLTEPVDESTGTPMPVFQFRDRGPARWYCYWAASGHHNMPNKSFRLLVGEPNTYKAPGALSIGGFSGTFNMRGEMINHLAKSAVSLRIEKPIAWKPMLFYNEGRHTLRAKTECKVDYFLERYMSHLIHWGIKKYKVDTTRISGGTLYFGLRHPEIFASMSFGTYTATYDYNWAPGSPAFLGPKGIKTVAGEDAWAMYSVGGYVHTYPDRDIPFLICISGTGKDRGHTSEFGWQDDPRGWSALMKARQTFVAIWGSERTLGPLMGGLRSMRWDALVPAFSNCSLDNNPGNGDPADGDYYGQINGYLLWEHQNQVDQKDKLELTVYVTSNCPQDTCTVDITPRHRKAFKPKEGESFTWTNQSVASKKEVQKGEVTADKWGLVTIKDFIANKGRNRLIIQKK